MKLKVSVSFIKSRYDEKETILKINETSADYLHVDLMDGVFVSQNNYSFSDIKYFLEDNKKPLDIHFMYSKPKEYIEKYVSLKPEFITVHLECEENIDELIDYIHSFGIKCGISIKPDTALELLTPYLNKIEQVLVMSVVPGEGGQKFMPSVIPKLIELKNIQSDFIISIDGGINDETIHIVKDYVDMVVSGSFICLNENYEKFIKILKK